ncbi:hypothetical protein M433DRAFT_6720 [Acidomyces richmondensis BFW]|nr:MAG: hypothetical protein FE78DRAFT_35148 [Acidomyces sp. 'richmondensis']KYG42954.1 hypothetical protein M433DRAFT_6720 [Acidomyces richmondensis BFW]
MPRMAPCHTLSGDDSSAEPMSQLLERLSSAVANVLNERDFDFTSKEAQRFLANLAPDREGKMDTQAAKMDFEQQIAIWRQRAVKFPKIYFDVVQLHSTMNEDSGIGKCLSGNAGEWTGRRGSACNERDEVKAGQRARLVVLSHHLYERHYE